MASLLPVLSRLWTPPADRRLASALALEPPAVAAPLPPSVPLVLSNDGAASRRRGTIDEQRLGIRTPWVPVGLRWGFEDMEPIWQNAEIGNLDPLARVIEAFRSEGVTAGLMDQRCGFVRKPIAFQGDEWGCNILRGGPGRRGLFRTMFPTSTLLDLMFTGIMADVAVAEFVDDPITRIPVLHYRDLHRLRYDWGERAWKYRGSQAEYLVEPGNGRWILFCPKSTHRPWRSGAWLPLMLAFVVMITSTYDAARFQAKNADPLKTITVPDGAPPEEVDRYEDFVQNWWERAPGIVLRWGATADLVETNGVGHHIFGTQREWAKQQILFTLTGSMGTAGEAQGIFNDATVAQDMLEGVIQDAADALAECLSVQGIGPVFERYGYVRHREEAPTCAWDCRSPARKLAEANAAGAVADNVAKLNAAVAADGKRVNAVAFIAQCGLAVPWMSIAEDENSAVALEFAPTDLASFVTVREARASEGLPPLDDARDDMMVTGLAAVAPGTIFEKRPTRAILPPAEEDDDTGIPMLPPASTVDDVSTLTSPAGSME